MMSQRELTDFAITKYLNNCLIWRTLNTETPDTITRALDTLPLPKEISARNFCQPIVEAYRENRLVSFLGHFLHQFSPLFLNKNFSDVNLETVGKYIFIPVISSSKIPDDLKPYNGKILRIGADIYYVNHTKQLEKIESERFNKITIHNDPEPAHVTYEDLSKALPQHKRPIIISKETIRSILRASINWLGLQLQEAYNNEENIQAKEEYNQIIMILQEFYSLSDQFTENSQLDKTWLSDKDIEKEAVDLLSFLKDQNLDKKSIDFITPMMEKLQQKENTSEKYKRYMLLAALQVTHQNLRNISDNQVLKEFLLTQKIQEAKLFLKSGGQEQGLYVPGQPNSSIFSDSEFLTLLQRKLSDYKAEKIIENLANVVDQYLNTLSNKDFAERMIALYKLSRRSKEEYGRDLGNDVHKLLDTKDSLDINQFKEEWLKLHQDATDDDINQQFKRYDALRTMTTDDFSALISDYQAKPLDGIKPEINQVIKDNTLKVLALMKLKTILESQDQSLHDKISQFLIHQQHHREILNLSQYSWWEKAIQCIYEFLGIELEPGVRISRTHDKIVTLIKPVSTYSFFNSDEPQPKTTEKTVNPPKSP